LDGYVTLALCCALAVLICDTPARAQAEADLFVAPDGDDGNPGTLTQPLRTIAAARDRLRDRLPAMDRDLTVVIRGGDYYLEQPLSFGPQDSGQNGHSVIYRSYPGETPVLVGGRKIEGWEKAEGSIYRTQVEDGWTFQQLFADGVRMTKARHPNEGYAIVEAGDEDDPAHVFGYAEGDLPAWEMGPEAQVYVWASYDWFASLVPIGAIDYANRLITLADRPLGPIVKRPQRRYYIQGVRAALDAPGEWFLDETEGTLYFWPPREPIEELTIVAPAVMRVVELRGDSVESPVHHVRLEGLTIAVSRFGRYFCETSGGTHGDTPWNEPANKEGMLYLENADDCAVRFCELANAGYSAVALNERAQRNEIYGNLIRDAGFHGVLLTGFPPRLAVGADGQPILDVNRDNQILNNHVHHCGRLVGHGGGIFIHSSGHNRVAHNLIHHMPRYGVCSKGSCQGPDGAIPYDEHFPYNHSRGNVYEFNDIHHCSLDTEDNGFISFHTPGRDCVVRNNLLHDGEREGLGGLGFGIYLDDGTSYFTVEKNVIYNIRNGDPKLVMPIFAKGIHNVIANNILIGEEKTGAAISTLEMAGLRCAFHKWSRNIVYLQGAHSHLWDHRNWAGDRLVECDSNLFWHPDGQYTVSIRGWPEPGLNVLTLDQWREAGFDRNSIVDDPGFADPEAHDYRLRPDSPAFKLGFEPIDTAQCGLLEDFPFPHERHTESAG
jgi:hypothetical protein